MRVGSSAAIVVFGLLSTGALAADLPSRRAPLVYAPPVPVFTWTGLYIGAQVGYEFGTSNAVSTSTVTGAVLDTASGRKNGVIGGGHFGYLFSTQSLPVLGGFFGQNGSFGFGTAGVIGVEADADGTSARAIYALPVAGVSDTARDGIQASIRGRLGVAFDRVLVYATGGVAFASLQNNYFSPALGVNDTLSQTRAGYTVGGGIEYAFTNNVSARVEYRYTDFGSSTENLPNTTGGLVNVTHRETDNRVQGGVSYKFDMFTPPVVARY